jgi:trigger factor
VDASCKRTLDISVPVEAVEQETERVVDALKQRVRLPGFRPGKAPSSLVRSRFAAEIREDVVKSLVPKHFHKAVEDKDLHIVGTPDVTDVHFLAGEPLTFKAEFEVAPDFELKGYLGLTVAYSEPEVTGEQVAERLERLREQKAEFVNVDPRPVADGDYAVISLEAVGQAPEGIGKQDELTVLIGAEDTLEAFSTNLRGGTPGDEKEFDVAYPEEYGDPKLSGKTIRFRANLKGIRRKELPELNDAFAADTGDFQSLDELKDEIRKSLLRETEFLASQEAKKKLIEQLVDMHEFPVPEAFLEQQIKMQVEQYLRSLQARGEDLSKVKLDWDKIRESLRERAARDVKASLLLDRIADRETIEVTNEEMDRELQRIARQGREPLAALRKRLEEDGGLRRIASRIRTDKTLNLLFEQARKVAQD